jgi:hypothetical protein
MLEKALARVEDALIVMLWDEYRTGKCLPNMTELMMRSRSANPEEVSPEFNQTVGYDEKGIPSPGASFWLEELDPPDWFIESLMVGPEDTKYQPTELRETLKVREKFKSKRSIKHRNN